MLTRSTITPGTVRSSAHGSRDVGISLSSSVVKFVPVPVVFGSTIGDSPMTVTVSARAATFNWSGKSTVPPTTTMTFSRTSVPNPCSAAVTLYMPGARFRKRNAPPTSVENV